MTSEIERRKHDRINVRWPITIITDQGTVKGESRNITVSGVFVYCDEPLRKDRTYQMIIGIPQQNPILVKGKVMWSNLDGLDHSSTFPGMGFYFLQLADEDRKFLADLISTQRES